MRKPGFNIMKMIFNKTTFYFYANKTIKLNTCNYTKNNPAWNYMFKVNNRNTRTRCEICSKLKIKIPKQRQHWYLYC